VDRLFELGGPANLESNLLTSGESDADQEHEREGVAA
jgi:hypothetical protein